MDRSPAKGGKPEEQDEDRNKQNAKRELAHRAAPRNAGNENADKRRPRNPPGPIENRPAGLPVGIGVGFAPETDDDQIADIVADIFNKAVEHKQRRAKDQDKAKQQEAQLDIKVTDPLDAAIQACHDRNGRKHGNDGNQNDLDRHRVGNTKQRIQTRTDLHDAKTKGGDNAKHRAKHGENIDHMAPGAINPFANDRIKGGADRKRQSLAVMEIGQRQANDAIKRPAMDAPMQERNRHCLFGCSNAFGFGHGRCEIVIKWLCHPPIEQTDTNAGTKQHGRPGKQAIFRLVGLTAQTHPAIRPDCKIETDHNSQVGHNDQKPAKIVPDYRLRGGEQRTCGFGKGRAEYDESQDQDGRYREDRLADPREGPEWPHLHFVVHDYLTVSGTQLFVVYAP